MASTSSQTPHFSASYSTPTSWDVFLSFRGEDTRYKFTSHLYSTLDRHGIRTFRDDPALHCGEVISDALIQAIHDSKIYVVVFSENYAFSHWCLDELVEIRKCSKTMQRAIIPVFYNIHPSVVRHQKESFKEAFHKHQLLFGEKQEKLNRWRLTLKEVAGFSGKHISAYRSEADIINEIVDEILLEINPKTLNVAKYPVGLDSRVEMITTVLSSYTEGVITIGIYGMGGVGKTTLSKAVFNQIYHQFQGSCFLANVREVSETAQGIVTLQQQLLDDVLKSKNMIKVHNVDQGKECIRQRIISTKVLVVMDDLDNLNQFEYLVGKFASGSVVIITTRDEEVLDKIEVEPKYRYKVTELDDIESLIVFTRHAFGDAKPNDSLMVLSKEIVCYAGGLPLALVVFGSYLYRRSDVGWKSFIEKLKRVPDSTIQQRLIISLDALESDDPMLKQIFIDIACLFIGKRKQEAVNILDTYYSYAEHNIDILMKRCLLTVNNRDILGMHDLLRDMGRNIARNNSFDEPGKHSRLWVDKDIYDVLEKHKGTEAIEAIIPYGVYRDRPNTKPISTLSTETFKMMRKLRFLRLTYIKNVTGSFEQTFENLRWFCWIRCPCKCLPSELYPQKLVSLELPYSQLRTLWETNKVFETLRTLNMAHSKDLTTTPDFTTLPALENLYFEGCESLEEVHKSIGTLVRLVSLDLQGCVKLTSLPDEICNLRALSSLNTSNCRGMKALPAELGNIKSLKNLDAGGLTVRRLPDSIGRLSKLVDLELGYCQNLETLPNTVCNLKSLKYLRIQNCISLQVLPVEMGNINSLKKIVLKNCTSLLYIVKLPPNLKTIWAAGCTSLNRLPNLCNLKMLEELRLTDCNSLKEIQGLEELTSIKELHLGGHNSNILTKPFFQIYSAFGHRIEIHIQGKKIPTWISQSLCWITQSSKLMCTASIDLSAMILCCKELSQLIKYVGFLGSIICPPLSPLFEILGDLSITTYTVTNTSSGFISHDSVLTKPDLVSMVILPRSILSSRNTEEIIELTANAKGSYGSRENKLTANAEILGIYPFYKSNID